MEDLFSSLCARTTRLYSQNKFREVQDIFTSFINECEGKDVDNKIKAKAINNRGHARYNNHNIKRHDK